MILTLYGTKGGTGRTTLLQNLINAVEDPRLMLGSAYKAVGLGAPDVGLGTGGVWSSHDADQASAWNAYQHHLEALGLSQGEVLSQMVVTAARQHDMVVARVRSTSWMRAPSFIANSDIVLVPFKLSRAEFTSAIADVAWLKRYKRITGSSMHIRAVLNGAEAIQSPYQQSLRRSSEFQNLPRLQTELAQRRRGPSCDETVRTEAALLLTEIIAIIERKIKFSAVPLIQEQYRFS